MKMKVGKGHWVAGMAAGVLAMADQADGAESSRPDIIVILADDLGFADLGCYGGEIRTPHLNRLAEGGLRYAQFYNAARCCPTRASLLTGVYPHEAGMGWMDNSDVRTPTYRGDLRKDVVTIAEVLRSAGYVTGMTGKWHVSDIRKNRGGIKDNWPLQRGFDEFYGIIGGATHYFRPGAHRGNEREPDPEDIYFTDAINDEAADFVRRTHARDPDQPFFLYVAHIAPHWPLHAREEAIAEYAGRYDGGWDALRKERLQGQYEVGLWESPVELSPRDARVRPWDEMTPDEQREFARRMEIYAAQVDVMDRGIGRLLATLEETGRMDNTLIFFLSDNGAADEFISSGPSRDIFGDLSDTWESYRVPWANAGNTPFREHKCRIHEGGMRTPLIAHWPAGIKQALSGSWVRDPGHLIDLMATALAVSGAVYPEEMDGQPVKLYRGVSLTPHFRGETLEQRPLFWEHEANIGMRDGDWKLVAMTPRNESFCESRLELFNIADDPTELNNLAGTYPERLASMYAAWRDWGEEIGVFPLDSRDWGQRSRNVQRNLNGEFDYGFAGWRRHNPDELVRIEIDESGVLSGPNAVRIDVLDTGTRPNRAILAMSFPTEGARPLALTFTARSERATELIVRIENLRDPSVKIADKTLGIGPDAQVFRIETLPVDVDASFGTRPNYQIAFYFGAQPVGDRIWIDAVSLAPMDP